jgi:ABC-type nitrate/sulfonate/bicarbonate transport system permease component
LAGWQIFSAYILPMLNPLAAEILPTPLSILVLGITLVKQGGLVTMVFHTLYKVVMGFILAAILGLAAGMFMGGSKKAGLSFRTLMEMLKPITPFAWLPLLLLWPGRGEKGIIMAVTVAGMFPVAIFTADGIESANATLIRAAQCLGCETKRQVFLNILLPGAMPHIFKGLRASIAISWRVVIIAEVIESAPGLGELIRYALKFKWVELALLGMAVIGLLGVILDFAVRGCGKPLLGWKEQYEIF